MTDREKERKKEISSEQSTNVKIKEEINKNGEGKKILSIRVQFRKLAKEKKRCPINLFPIDRTTHLISVRDIHIFSMIPTSGIKNPFYDIFRESRLPLLPSLPSLHPIASSPLLLFSFFIPFLFFPTSQRRFILERTRLARVV